MVDDSSAATDCSIYLSAFVHSIFTTPASFSSNVLEILQQNVDLAGISSVIEKSVEIFLNLLRLNIYSAVNCFISDHLQS